jgi:hypothetical protein
MELFIQGSLTHVVAVEALIEHVEEVVLVVGELRKPSARSRTGQTQPRSG